MLWYIAMGNSIPQTYHELNLTLFRQIGDDPNHVTFKFETEPGIKSGHDSGDGNDWFQFHLLCRVNYFRTERVNPYWLILMA